MLSNYKIITLSHHQTNLRDLGKFVLPELEDILVDLLFKAKEKFNIQEIFYVSTCNRVMFLLYGETNLDIKSVIPFYHHFLPNLTETDNQILKENIKIFYGLDAVNHLLNVASSIDSLVVGERQILSQLRDAYEHAKNKTLCGDAMRILMDQAVVTSKEVFSNTRIGEKPVSVASLAVLKLLRYSIRPDARILLVGAGQTNHIVAKILQSNSFTNIHVFNRTLQKAEAIAKLFPNGKASLLKGLENYTQGFDALIACTSSPSPIIDLNLFASLVNNEKSPKVIIDLAVPNNISEEVASLKQVHYIEVESLRHIANENMSFREAEVIKASDIISANAEKFSRLFKQRKIEKAFSTIPDEIKAIKEKAITEVFKKDLAGLDEPTKELIEKMLTYMEKKCVGVPMKAAKEIVL
ncbi:MAG: glutamyl-tRNA reductase [Bacteroidetes bacterium]|nr:glutamyl-tRNA reductase [Bacteroidota bacterium]